MERRQTIDVKDAAEQETLQQRAYELTSMARTIADNLVAIELDRFNQSKREREQHLLTFAGEIASFFAINDSALNAAAAKALRDRANVGLNAHRPPNAPLRVPLHWPLEFPEIFASEDAGFNAIVGNPPFLGGKKITGRYGRDYRALLQSVIAEGRKGHADLVGYFVLRAAQTATRFGLIATNTIGQGDTREVSLDALISNNWRIVRAERSRPWPGTAAIQVAEVWCTNILSDEQAVLGDHLVTGISPLLMPISRVIGVPYRLASNTSIAFIGSYLLGMGFTIDVDEAQDLLETDQRNRNVLFRYLSGEDVCDRSNLVASRYAVSFFDWSEARSKQFAIFHRIEQLVKPEREKRGGDFAKRWWQHWRPRMRLYRQLKQYDECVVIPRVSKYTMPVLVSARQLFSDSLAVFASNDVKLYGVLTSELHRTWALARGSTLETRFRYTPTDCFETFPLPREWSEIGAIMRALHDHRTALMLSRNEGITMIYNRYHDYTCVDESIAILRTLHSDLDRAVLSAYDWDDLTLNHDFRDTDEGSRYTIGDPVRFELLDRLLELNHERHKAQSSVRAPDTGKPRAKRRPTGQAVASPQLL